MKARKSSLFVKYVEELTIVYISFWLTILLIRSIAFIYYNRPCPLILFPYWHLVIAFPIFFISLISYLFKRPSLPYLCLGTGLGILADGFGLLTRSPFSDYWSLFNFLLLLLVNFIFLFLLWLGNQQEVAPPKPPSKPRQNPDNPFISVVIPAYNEENYIGNVLQSLLEQDFQDFEIIVVDNCSEDRTREIAKKFGARVLIEKKKTIGAVRQKGLLEAKGEIIAMTDADVILPEDWLSRIVSEFRKDDHLVAFGGLYNLYSGPVIARIWIRHFAHFLWIFDKWLSDGLWNIPASNLAFRKSAALKIGGFNTELKIGEDADFTLRLGKIGKVVLDPCFRVRTSGRRYHRGFFKGTWTYAKNTIGRLLLRKNVQTPLPAIRKEPSSFHMLSPLPFLIMTIYLFSLFFFRSPYLAMEKVKMEKRLAKVEKVIKNKFQKVEHFHLKR
ncbi:glycosyltransferase [bacterium]|nr:glycosyltransferase [bacterium]